MTVQLKERIDEMKVLEEKCEELIEHASDIGANAEFLAVREAMDVGKRWQSQWHFDLARAHLETKIAEANRRQAEPRSRRPISVVIRDIFNIFRF